MLRLGYQSYTYKLSCRTQVQQEKRDATTQDSKTSFVNVIKYVLEASYSVDFVFKFKKKEVEM